MFQPAPSMPQPHEYMDSNLQVEPPSAGAQGAPLQPHSGTYIVQIEPLHSNTGNLYALRDMPAMIVCPACGVQCITIVEYHPGNTTHILALILCVCICLGCVPYFFNTFKDVVHRCGSCSIPIAKWYRNGGVDVLYHQPAPAPWV